MKSLGYTCFLAIFLTTLLAADEIRIAASDLLGDSVVAPLKAHASERSLELKIDSIGTLPALDRLRSDEIDLALIAIPEGEEVPSEEFSIYPFAYDVAVVVVNDSNPLDEISMAHLGGIFGRDEEFNFNTWGELGLTGWGNRSIKQLVGVAEDSIALELFRYSVFSGGSMKQTVAMVKEGEIEGLLAADTASIGILSRLPDNKKLKVLMISSGSDTPAFGPTDVNIHYGDYPIRLSFYIAYKPSDDAKLRQVIRVLLDDEIAANLAKKDLFALPETVRRQLQVDIDLQEKL